MTETDEERYCKAHGWRKVIGFKIDLEQMRDNPDDWDWLYFSKDDLDDFLTICEFWQSGDFEEEIFEDIDPLIEFIEEHEEETYDDWCESHK